MSIPFASRLVAIGSALLLIGCSDPTPWVGSYALDLTKGVQSALDQMTDAAENRGTKLPEVKAPGRGILLVLATDQTFRFERNLLVSKTVSTGTYSVHEGAMNLTVTIENDRILEEARHIVGQWQPGRVALDGWGVLVSTK